MQTVGNYNSQEGTRYPVMGSGPIEGKNHIAEYMKSFEPDAAAPGIVEDVFTGKTVPVYLLAYSDSGYSWTTEDIYYFEEYNIILPDDFITHALNQG